ncbi:MAG TPA: hypothetical protein VN611_05890 [Patescibacteria group bacterium]|nr:hypothetical protein [Patescibacteria group bacterium]
MVLKIRCAIGLALVAGVLTLIVGLMNGTRSMTLFYRILVSVIAFGVCGYGYGFLVDKYLPVILQAIKGTEAEATDLVAAEDMKVPEDLVEAAVTDTMDEPDSQPSFTPLAPEKLETVPRSQE